MLLIIKKKNKPKQLFTLTKKCINILPNWNKANAHFGKPEQTASVEGEEVLTTTFNWWGEKNLKPESFVCMHRILSQAHHQLVSLYASRLADG